MLWVDLERLRERYIFFYIYIYIYICDCACENQAYWSFLRKWGFNRTDKYKIETSQKKIRKQNCIKYHNRFDLIVIYWFSKLEARNKTKTSSLYMGVVQNCKLHLKPGFLMHCHIYYMKYVPINIMIILLLLIGLTVHCTQLKPAPLVALVCAFWENHHAFFFCHINMHVPFMTQFISKICHFQVTSSEDIVQNEKVRNPRVYCCNCAKKGHFAYVRRHRTCCGFKHLPFFFFFFFFLFVCLFVGWFGLVLVVVCCCSWVRP